MRQKTDRTLREPIVLQGGKTATVARPRIRWL